jgi:diguanylate cyclase (GGDEF)-like protein
MAALTATAPPGEVLGDVLAVASRWRQPRGPPGEGNTVVPHLLPRPPAIRTLSALYFVSGTLCLLGILRPLDARTPVGLLLVLGPVGVLGSALIWWCGRWRAAPLVHGGVLVLLAGVCLLATRAATLGGIAGLGPVLICIGLYVAHFCSAPAARAYLAGIAVLSTAGAIASGVPGILAPWAINIIALVFVIEVQIRLIRALRHSADRDPVTGLLNRRAWLHETNRAVAEAARRGGSLTVVLIDLDQFKAVNDLRGHHAGDQLLRELAVAWQSEVRVSDVLARYGGDEFAVLLSGTAQPEARRLLERMTAAHQAPWSAGTAEWEAGDSCDDLVRRADTALYRHKSERSGRRSLAPVVRAGVPHAEPA